MNMPKIRVPIAPVGKRHRSAKDYDRRQNVASIQEEEMDFCIDVCEKSVCPFFCTERLKEKGWITCSSWDEDDGLLEWYEHSKTGECLSADELKERLS